MPSSSTQPALIATILSLFRTVDNLEEEEDHDDDDDDDDNDDDSDGDLCATMMVVLPSLARSSADCTLASLAESRAEVASSSSRMRGFRTSALTSYQLSRYVCSV